MKRKEFDYCIEKNELIQTWDKDKALATELLKLAEHRHNFWKEVELEDKYPSLYVEGHYEIIKELCTAILALDGWNLTLPPLLCKIPIDSLNLGGKIKLESNKPWMFICLPKRNRTWNSILIICLSLKIREMLLITEVQKWVLICGTQINWKYRLQLKH